MKINEIVIYPSREEELSNYLHRFEDAEYQPAFSGLRFAENRTNVDHELGLFDMDDLVAYLRLDVRDHGMWQITYSLTDPKFRGQGCFRYLLLKGVMEHGSVLSDAHQTMEAASAWKSLIKYPGGKMKISVYDLDTGKTIPTQDISEEEIWNQKVSPVLVASKKEYTTEAWMRISKDDEWHKKNNTGRDHDNIWFGPKSSNDGYVNP